MWLARSFLGRALPLLAAGFVALCTSTVHATEKSLFDGMNIRKFLFPSAARDFLLYRELGHALIDQRGLTAVGPMDQAADAFAIMMMSDRKQHPVPDLGTIASQFYELRARTRTDQRDRAEDHSRYGRVLCLTVGANPDKREQFGIDRGLSRDEVTACGESYRQLADIWRNALGRSSQPFIPIGSESPFRFEPLPPDLMVGVPSERAAAIAFRINLLGVDLTLSKATSFVFRACGEPAARYDPTVPEVVFCYETLEEIDGLSRFLR